MKNLLLPLLVFFISLTLSAQQPRHILQKAYDGLEKGLIKPDASVLPYPDLHDRAAWDRLFGGYKAEAIKKGEAYLKYEWKVVKATDYLEFERSGSRNVMQDPNEANKKALTTLCLAELAEDKGRFMDQIMNGVWFQTERTSWVHSAHQIRQKTGRALPDSRDILIDLGSQKWGLTLAMALHFFRKEFDKADPSISFAVEAALKRNILDPYLDDSKNQKQNWLGFTLPKGGSVNNWNPWCNSAVLLIFLLVEKDPVQLQKAVERSIRSVDIYLDTNKLDGACDEGPGYWNHAAGRLYDYLRTVNDATGNHFGCFDDAQVRAMACYQSRVYLGDGWSVNYGDGGARTSASSELVFRFGKDCGLDEMMDFAVYLNASPDNRIKRPMLDYADFQHSLETLRYEAAFREYRKAALNKAGGDYEKMKCNLRASVPSYTWYDQTQHWLANNNSGWRLSAKAGNNGESHNHNDVGTIVLFVDELPVFIDAGPATYTRQTFSKTERYKIWTMQSQWHNLPAINGIDQMNGKEYAAKSTDASEKAFRTDISGAYPSESSCTSWTRSCVLDDSGFKLTDRYVLKSRQSADVERFLVWSRPSIPGETLEDGYVVKKGEVVLNLRSFDGKRTGRLKMNYPKNLVLSLTEKSLDDIKHRKVWGKSLYRLDFSSSAKAPLKGSYDFSVSRF